MNILVFKTNIDTNKKFNYVGQILNNIPQIRQWSVDLEDIDKVLRIEAEGVELTELDVIELLNREYIVCEELI